MLNKLFRIIKKKYFPSEFDKEINRWFNDDGDSTKRLYYNITENSLVIDLGGYKGQFASDIFSKYLCNIFIFEPISDFYKILKERFERNRKIQVFNIALGNEDKEEIFYLDNGSTSIINRSNKGDTFKRKVMFRDIEVFFN